MPEPTSRPCSRAGLRQAAARVSALCAAGALMASLTLPAAALGEDGPFDFPAETDTLAMVPGAVTHVPLGALIDDQLEAEVDLSTALLAVPEDSDPAVQGLMEVAEDGRSLTVAGEGTWTLLGADLVFTPLAGVEGPAVPISLTIEGLHDVRSRPAEFTPELVELENIPVRGSAGQNT
ncbi:MAG: Ig-like domain-containing protein, partial [Brachybacterium tyrofermentans]